MNIGLVVSLSGHVIVLGGIILASLYAPESEPLIDPDSVMEVSLLAMPKQTNRMVQKATRAPDPVIGEPDPEPTPTETVRTDSTMVDPQAKAKQGADPTARKSREETLRELRRQEALDRLNDDPVGKTDRSATSAEGVEGSTGTGPGVGDPRLAAYYEQVKQAVLPNFRPLQEDPALRVRLRVTIDRSGNVSNPKVWQSSGDVSFDQAALRAIRATKTVPAPPAELMPGDTATVTIEFTPKDGA